MKLLAMCGVWLGAAGVAWAALWTVLAGGVLALAYALWTGVLGRVLANLRFMLTTSLLEAQNGRSAAVEAPIGLTGRLPYALAITCGVAAQALRQWAGT